MGAGKLSYILLLLALLIFNIAIFAVPYLASQGDPSADTLYLAFAPTCHQLISRSLCLTKSQSGAYSISDCLPSEKDTTYSRANSIAQGDAVGYKFPVCSRDVAIYLAMLLGLLILPFIQKTESEEWPPTWILIAAAVPVAIDGGTQLFGFRESTNSMRIITGAIIGVVLPFYLLPMLNSLASFIRQKLAEWKKEGLRKDEKQE